MRTHTSLDTPYIAALAAARDLLGLYNIYEKRPITYMKRDLEHKCNLYERPIKRTHIRKETFKRDKVREVGGWGRDPFSRNLMSPTPRRKWYLTTGRRAH